MSLALDDSLAMGCGCGCAPRWELRIQSAVGAVAGCWVECPVTEEHPPYPPYKNHCTCTTQHEDPPCVGTLTAGFAENYQDLLDEEGTCGEFTATQEGDCDPLTEISRSCEGTVLTSAMMRDGAIASAHDHDSGWVSIIGSDPAFSLEVQATGYEPTLEGPHGAYSAAIWALRQTSRSQAVRIRWVERLYDVIYGDQIGPLIAEQAKEYILPSGAGGWEMAEQTLTHVGFHFLRVEDMTIRPI